MWPHPTSWVTSVALFNYNGSDFIRLGECGLKSKKIYRNYLVLEESLCNLILAHTELKCNCDL